jgi:signal peptidase I
MKRMKWKQKAGMMAAILAVSAPVTADDPNTVSGDRTTDMVVDVLVVRPLGLATTVVGAVLTVVALPFTIPSGSMRESAQYMVVEPAEYTFKRPLGEFESRD